MVPRRTFPKDPDARLDYYFDWRALTNGTGDSNWLAAGETIAAFEVAVDAGLMSDQPAAPALVNGDTAVLVWLSGGTAGRRYQVACKVTTSAGRVDERTMTVDVYDR
jgi:hypothetical protein